MAIKTNFSAEFLRWHTASLLQWASVGTLPTIYSAHTLARCLPFTVPNHWHTASHSRYKHVYTVLYIKIHQTISLSHLYWLLHWLSRWSCSSTCCTSGAHKVPGTDRGGRLGKVRIRSCRCINFSNILIFNRPGLERGSQHSGHTGKVRNH